jgi:hypothetical protein
MRAQLAWPDTPTINYGITPASRAIQEPTPWRICQIGGAQARSAIQLPRTESGATFLPVAPYGPTGCPLRLVSHYPGRVDIAANLGD